MGGGADPRNPEQLRNGLATADQQPAGDVGQVCATCPDNWVEAGAIDETSGAPVPGLGYRIYDVATGDMVASGILNAEGKSRRHNIPMPITQLYAVFGTEKAMDEAEAKIDDLRREQALQANAVKDWHGIESGLSREDFNKRWIETARNGESVFADRGFASQAGRGASGLSRLPGAVGEAIFGDGVKAAAERFYEPYMDEAWEQYQLVTGARAATGGESFGAGAAQGLTFGFDEEISAGLNSLFDDRSYEELVESQRQIMRQKQISNPGMFMGGEIAGALPTVFVPVGGAAGNAARAGKGIGGAMRSGAATGAGLGTISGAGHDEGGLVDRLDGAAIGAATGGVAGAVLSGAGVLIARGVSRTRIWGRVARQLSRTTADERKFSEYIFRPGATHGKNVPFEALGYSREHSGKLAEMWRRQAAERVSQGQYTLGRLDQYGQRINVGIAVPRRGTAAGKTSYMNSGWMLGPDKTLRLNTPFPGFTR